MSFSQSLTIVSCILCLALPVASLAPGAIEGNVSSTGGSVLYVGGSGPGNYTKIQDALDNASPGDTVYVYAGTYQEHVTVHTQVHFIGQNRSTTIIDGELTDTVVSIRADGTTMSGFTVKNGRHYIMSAGIMVMANYTSINNCEVCYNYNGIFLDCYTTRNFHNVVSNNWIHHNFDSIIVGGNSYCEVSNNTIMFTEATAIFASGDFVFPCHHNLIADNILERNSDGIDFTGDTYQMLVTRNIILDTIYNGMWLNCSDSMFSWNSIRDSGDYAVWCDFCSNNTYLHNDFINAGYKLMWLECHKTRDTLRGNYWDRHRLLPKPVPINFYNRIFYTVLFDWHPAWKPNVAI